MNATPADSSGLDLLDPDRVRRDDTGRSIGFFCRKLPAAVGPETIRALVDAAERSAGRNVRLCLHESPESDFHSMIIFERQGTYYPPHFHETKGETWHVIEGEMAAFVFSEHGDLLEARRLSPQGCFLYRLEKRTIHTVFPLTDYVIYHESKPGPFLGPSDSVVPDWAPERDEPDQVAAFLRTLRAALPE